MTKNNELQAPFPPEVIHWRVGATTQDKSKGMALAYIDARDVMERLDAVCSEPGWQCRYSDVGGGKLCCEIGIFVRVGDEFEWVWKADGAGSTDVEADKGAFSDSFKRAAVRWGIGRYLYDLDSPWVQLEQKGRSHVIKDSELPRLRAILTRAAPQASQKPAGSETVFDACKVALKGAVSIVDLQERWKENYIVAREECTADQFAELTAIKDAKKSELEKAA